MDPMSTDYAIYRVGADTPLLAGASPFLCPCVDPMATSGYLSPHTLSRSLAISGSDGDVRLPVSALVAPHFMPVCHAHVRPRPQTHCVTVPHRARHIVEGRCGRGCVCGLTSAPFHQPPRCWPPRQCSPFPAFRASPGRQLPQAAARQRGPHRGQWQ